MIRRPLPPGALTTVLALLLCSAQSLVASPTQSASAGVTNTGNTDFTDASTARALKQIWIQDRFTGESMLTSVPLPDTTLWNKARIAHYEDSLGMPTRPPLGVLNIDRLKLEVPVYNGAEELQLNLGAGRVPGTGTFDGAGNLAISSHRDGFFRVLKDIEVGDEIQLRSVRGEQVFVVSDLSVVHKDDHSVLHSSDERMLTLVTCHPFYFVGNAPDRFIVHAVPREDTVTSP